MDTSCANTFEGLDHVCVSKVTGDVEMVEEHQLPKRETSASRRWPVARSVRGLRLPIQCFVLHDTDDRKSARYGNFFSVQWRFP